MDYNHRKHRPDSFGIIEPSQYMVDKEQILECPYDKTHLIRAKRFQYHLIKCRKNYRGQDMVSCPFNARHVIPRPEQRHHIANCPDKTLLEPDHEYNTNRKNNPDYQGNISVPKYLQDREVPKTSEDWDDEIENDFSQYSYPPARNTNGTLFYQQRSYQTTAGRNAHEGELQEPASLRQPRNHPASMGTFQVNEGIPQHQQTNARGEDTAMPAAPTPTWSRVAGFGRGIPIQTGESPVVGQSARTGIGRGIVRPPPGFGRGQHGQRAGPTIAANIYNNIDQ